MWLVPVIVALTSLSKVYVNSKWAPLISLVLGVLGAFAFNGAGLSTVFSGLVIGLTASGLYSGAKTSIFSPSAV